METEKRIIRSMSELQDLVWGQAVAGMVNDALHSQLRVLPIETDTSSLVQPGTFRAVLSTPAETTIVGGSEASKY